MLENSAVSNDLIKAAGGEMVDSTRDHLIDKWIRSDVWTEPLTNKLFVRLIAKNCKFEGVDFKYSIFDTSYLRDCVFESCDFTGCRFVGTNLHGSTFSGCKFNYATFEKTTIDPSILDTECPPYENLIMRFARSLRVNYQQLGDAEAVKKAIGVELKAAETHLHKSWKSKESYYRKKYKKWARVVQFGEWTGFKTLDFVWGNGESPIKLMRFLLIILVAIAIVHVFTSGNPSLVASYLDSLWVAPQIFLGTLSPEEYAGMYESLIVFIRLLMIGFFISILIKRLNRR